MAHILVVNDTARTDEIRLYLECHHQLSIFADIACAINSLNTIEQKTCDRAVFDLIVCAVHIRGRSNKSVFDLLKWTTNDEQFESVPFIILDCEPTNLPESMVNSLKSISRKLGTTDYIDLKEFGSRDLLIRIERHLPRHLHSACERI